MSRQKSWWLLGDPSVFTKGLSDYPTLETITYPIPFGTFELMSIFRTFHGWDMWSLTGWYVLFLKGPWKTPNTHGDILMEKKSIKSLRRNNESSPKPSTSSIPKIIKIHKVCPLSWISRGGMTYISTYFGGEITPGKAIYKATYRGYIKLYRYLHLSRNPRGPSCTTNFAQGPHRGGRERPARSESTRRRCHLPLPELSLLEVSFVVW